MLFLKFTCKYKYCLLAKWQQKQRWNEHFSNAKEKHSKKIFFFKEHSIFNNFVMKTNGNIFIHNKNSKFQWLPMKMNWCFRIHVDSSYSYLAEIRVILRITTLTLRSAIEFAFRVMIRIPTHFKLNMHVKIINLTAMSKSHMQSTAIRGFC